MKETLEKVRDFAADAHGEQIRKYLKEPYINHPVRVMDTCRKVTDDVTILSAALLHDVLEDTDTDEKAMREFLKTLMDPEKVEKTVSIVIELTDVYTKDKYPKLNRRLRKDKELFRIAKTSAEAQTVKYADIIDNAPDTAEYDPDFAPKFLHEYQAILKKANKGDPLLYETAKTTVESTLKQLSSHD